MCGEKLCDYYTTGTPLGSPPRVRGKESYRVIKSVRYRITPACAGKSLCLFSACAGYRDHPRVCGEKLNLATMRPCGSGSPPRVRGKGNKTRRIGIQDRITPACAGKRRVCLAVNPNRRDHPRVCGEKPTPEDDFRCDVGSPPRVRGKGFATKVLIAIARITPACAGKRGYVSVSCSTPSDHPRVCGEKANLWILTRSNAGSPPRVRGKAGKAATIAVGTGITPACAGKSAAKSWQTW